MKDYLSGIISILASFQLLFVSVFLFTHKKGNRRNNGLLGLIFLLFEQITNKEREQLCRKQSAGHAVSIAKSTAL